MSYSTNAASPPSDSTPALFPTLQMVEALVRVLLAERLLGEAGGVR
jgi:hypothetical protein